jgi:hypothetical protein
VNTSRPTNDGRPRARPVLWIGAGLVAILAFLFLLHYVPFDPLSYAAWVGILGSLLGLVCLARPIRLVGIPTRGRAALVVLAGVTLAAVSIVWPARAVPVVPTDQRLDAFLPEVQFAEYHEGVVRAPRERVLEAMRDVSFADMPAAVFLMRLRAMASGDFSAPPVDSRPILDMISEPGTGFLPLDVSDPSELVYGMVGRPWVTESPPDVSGPGEFLEFDEPGHIRVAFNIRMVELDDGRYRVSTETRTLGNDAEARRVFARYWRVIYPGSAIIRRVWLDAIIRRAEGVAG